MLNISILIGRLVADPELKHTPNDIAVTSFSIAVERSYKSGEERKADFIDIVAWRATAEFICKYFRKGQMIAIDGSIQTRTYTDKDGKKRKAVEILAANAHFAGGNKNDGHTQKSASPDISVTTPQGYSSGDIGDFEEIVNDDDLPF